MTEILTASLPIRNDPRYIICERAMEDKRYAKVLEQLDRGTKTMREGMHYLNMDGPLYHDTRQQSIVTAAQTSITLASTDKLLHPGSLTSLPALYFGAGKKIRVTVYGSMTTAATPGNIGVELYYGTTDAGGTLLASSAAIALVANATTLPVIITANLICRGGAVPTAIPTLSYAWFNLPIGLITAANYQAGGNGLIPALTPAAVNIDTTTAQGFNIQIKRTGSTAETFTTHDVTFEALT